MIGRRTVLSLLAAGLPARAFAQAMPCPSTPASRLVKAYPRRATLERNPASADDVAKAVAGLPDRRFLAARFGGINAAVVAEFNYELRLILTSNDQPLRTCVVVSVAEVELRIESHRILLPRDAACRRAALVAHAERHAQINLDCLADAQQRIEAALTAALPTLRPVESTSRNPTLVTRNFKRVLTGPVEKALDAAIADARERHAALTARPLLGDELRRCT